METDSDSQKVLLPRGPLKKGRERREPRYRCACAHRSIVPGSQKLEAAQVSVDE